MGSAREEQDTAATHSPLAATSLEKHLLSLSRLARNVNEEALSFLGDLPPLKTEVAYLSLQLIRASFDHGRGLLLLIESSQRDMAGPALALHRSQIENFLRGIFIGFLASPEQINDFLENDDGIREKTPNGKWVKVGINTLADKVEAFLHGISANILPENTKLSSMVRNAWSPLCGFVHGGQAIHDYYVDGQGEIGANIPTEGLLQVVCNCYAITNFAFIILLERVYHLNGIPFGSPLQEAIERFMKARNAMLNRHGEQSA
jgi:hypothetical protein